MQGRPTDEWDVTEAARYGDWKPGATERSERRGEDPDPNFVDQREWDRRDRVEMEERCYRERERGRQGDRSARPYGQDEETGFRPGQVDPRRGRFGVAPPPEDPVFEFGKHNGKSFRWVTERDTQYYFPVVPCR